MAYFEKVSKYADDADLAMPIRKTEHSAGYDMVAAEDYVIPSALLMAEDVSEAFGVDSDEYLTLDQMKQVTTNCHYKPTLVSTGMKCHLDPGTYLQLSVRSSSPLKYWLCMANGVGK